MVIPLSMTDMRSSSATMKRCNEFDANLATTFGKDPLGPKVSRRLPTSSSTVLYVKGEAVDQKTKSRVGSMHGAPRRDDDPSSSNFAVESATDQYLRTHHSAALRGINFTDVVNYTALLNPRLRQHNTTPSLVQHSGSATPRSDDDVMLPPQQEGDASNKNRNVRSSCSSRVQSAMQFRYLDSHTHRNAAATNLAGVKIFSWQRGTRAVHPAGRSAPARCWRLQHAPNDRHPRTQRG